MGELKMLLSYLYKFENEFKQDVITKYAFMKYLGILSKFKKILGKKYNRAKSKRKRRANFLLTQRIHFTYMRIAHIFKDDESILLNWLLFCLNNSSIHWVSRIINYAS